jgi:hypothetical protein
LQIVRTNLNTNPRGLVAFAEYSNPTAHTITTVTGLSGHPDGITTANRVTYGSSSNPGVTLYNSVVSGTTYTISAWVYHETIAPTPGSQGLAQNAIGSQPSPPAIVVGVWQRLVWTQTANGTTNLGFRVSSQSGAGTFSYLITGIVIENSFADTGYFYDGYSVTRPDAGDFTYAWTGTAGASTSIQRAPAPTWVNATGSAIRALYQSGDRPHGPLKFIRLLNNSGNVAVGINPTDTVIKSGTPRTDLVWLRSSRSLDIRLRYRTIDGAATVDWGRTVLPANQWTLLRCFGSPSIGDNAALGVITDTTTAMQAGDTIDVGAHMCVQGTYLGDFIDGDMAFSKWDGTANSSTSVGYPPQLLDIAGKPDFDVAVNPGANTEYVLPGGYTATEPRTIYTVYKSILDIADSGNWPLTMYGWDSLSDSTPDTTITLRQQLSSVVGSNNILARKTCGGGAVSGGSKVATNVVAYGLNATGNVFIQPNNGAVVTDSVLSLLHERIRI